MRYLILTISIIISLLCGTSANAETEVKPWVTRVSSPAYADRMLHGHHLAIWPSHGRYYNLDKEVWEWQRPQLYCTTEDLFTQSIVLPFLIPMLENAGANVFVPRERDWQTEEAVVDNDVSTSGYAEHNGTEKWHKAPRAGFKPKGTPYQDGDRPFSSGTARMVHATQGKELSRAYYRPKLNVSGRYGVYVSYQTVDESVDDAEYIVMHQGMKTVFHVNQQMGSGTWVYLGAFDFDSNSPEQNCVIVTNKSGQHRGVVTTDAVRFGGGMGNHERNGHTSGLPRAMECARYYTEYAGAPRAVFTTKGNRDDYSDDINTRALMCNWLSYGAATNPGDSNSACPLNFDPETYTYSEAAGKDYMDRTIKANRDSIGKDFPDPASRAMADSIAHAITDSIVKIPVQYINVLSGKQYTGRVPLEMQLAFHSDAGWQRDFRSTYGTLGICTRNFNNRKLASGESRNSSYNLASSLVKDIQKDLRKQFGAWNVRDVWDKNYGETRVPAQTAAILEMLSHENFPDMRYGHDPYFKFVLARSIYKTITRFMASKSGIEAVIQPLAPNGFCIKNITPNKVQLSWSPVEDKLEPTAVAKQYVLYTRVNDHGYDNGKIINGTSHTVTLKPNALYRFKVTAMNEGGESFPTDELVAVYSPEAQHTVMIINGFHRLSSPTVVNNDSICGFDLNDDIGLSYGKTPAWCGQQLVFSKKRAGKADGLGYSGNELMGRFTAGNDFNYSAAHAKAIMQAGAYNIISMSSEAVNDSTDLTQYAMVDVLLGNEKDDGHSLRTYKSFLKSMQSVIQRYTDHGGRLLVSGSYIGSDMQTDAEKEWLAQNLHIKFVGTDREAQPFDTDSIADLVHANGLSVPAYRHVNGEHYASVVSDVIIPADEQLAATQHPFVTYASGRSAAVTYKDKKNRVLAMGFPFECIKDADHRSSMMKQIMAFLFAGH